MFNLIHMESVAKVDIIVRKEEEYRRTEFARRQRVKLADFNVWIVSGKTLFCLNWCGRNLRIPNYS
jgi:hypothetical protein